MGIAARHGATGGLTVVVAVVVVRVDVGGRGLISS